MLGNLIMVYMYIIFGGYGFAIGKKDVNTPLTCNDNIIRYKGVGSTLSLLEIVPLRQGVCR